MNSSHKITERCVIKFHNDRESSIRHSGEIEFCILTTEQLRQGTEGS
jgi:hypothetical protein